MLHHTVVFRVILVGSSQGRLGLFDLRIGGTKSDKRTGLIGALHGTGGSVKALTTHPNIPLSASVCYDRYLYLHNTITKKLIRKVWKY